MTGYSKTPLEKKLGLKDHQRVAWINRPAQHDNLSTCRDFDAVFHSSFDNLSAPLDVIHMFTDSRQDFERALPYLLAALKKDGVIWISWPKQASKMATDLTENIIRDAALKTTLVDVKVCAADDIWSGLKLVIRKTHRANHP